MAMQARTVGALVFTFDLLLSVGAGYVANLISVEAGIGSSWGLILGLFAFVVVMAATTLPFGAWVSKSPHSEL